MLAPVTTDIIVVEGIVKRIVSGASTLAILDGLSLYVRRGQSVAIVGRSGSGKTTLLSLLAGLDLPDAGKLSLDGHDLASLDEDGRAALRASGIGFVFQSFQLLPGLTAVENVMLPIELAGGKDAAPRAREALTRVGLDHRLDHYPSRLSGGEQQRVAIARAFAGQPAILFADEPTGNLDRATGAGIVDLLFSFNRDQGTTLVLVTHDVELASRCDRMLTLRDGRLHEEAA
jgi:putative ABC transport system ATP-binding protein